MFGRRKLRPPLTTFQRVDIELLMRRTIETLGAGWVRDKPIVTTLSQLDLDHTGREALLSSACNEIQQRLPAVEPCEVIIAEASQLGHPSTYRPGRSDLSPRISVADETLDDPLRTVIELSFQFSQHFWQSRPDPSELDTHPRTTHLLPICCGLGVLASDASLYDQQWSQAGWAGWSISRSGYYTAVEIGYAMALLSRTKGEAKPRWASEMRLDSRDVARKASRYFADHERAGGHLLFDADAIPSTSCDKGQLASWLRGNDLAFALAAGYALSKLDDLSPLVIEAAIEATRTGDKDLMPVATRLLGRGRHPSSEAELRIRQLIRNDSPQTCLAAIQSANAVGMPLAEFGAKISKLLDLFAEDSIALVDVIGQQGKSFGFLGPKICAHIARAIREIDDELTAALLDCLSRIVDDPTDAIQSRIKSPEIRQEALERLRTT